ncbi:DMT family transporter [Anaerotignum sp.]|uniref:DMT family transporter n=1 Tax=Anaerotignum sp. TaxID=2039241 RepID=UPI002A91E1FB|nr:DMT family transporter [Anaerotignum sp.]MCI7657937.1 DMT family transporter [Clostridia bacterium]MDY5415870.1 DMT family transporter [Anaerotignum sp.]
MTSQKTAIFWAVLAAGLYALNAPVSKLLLEEVPPTMMAALLYLGAGVGLVLVRLVQRMAGKGKKEVPLTKKDMPYTVGMVVLDIAAPIFLMVGLTMTTAANASLLNNFEIVATAVIALFIFREAISRRLWLAIVLVTISSAILSVEDMSSFTFSYGSIFVLLACVCWGLENNCTRMISHKDPLEIVVIKGFGSGLGSLVLAFCLGENALPLVYGVCTLLLGFVAYGLSIFFYIYAQRYLGAAKTSAYYALAPFMATALSLVIFREKPSISFLIALWIMAMGTYFASTDNVHEK